MQTFIQKYHPIGRLKSNYIVDFGPLAMANWTSNGFPLSQKKQQRAAIGGGGGQWGVGWMDVCVCESDEQ